MSRDGDPWQRLPESATRSTLEGETFSMRGESMSLGAVVRVMFIAHRNALDITRAKRPYACDSFRRTWVERLQRISAARVSSTWILARAAPSPRERAASAGYLRRPSLLADERIV